MEANINNNCLKHPNNRIEFVCTGNAWHFEPLCSMCLPEHTKNHNKNIKVQIESISEVINKAKLIKEKAYSMCKERLERCSKVISE